MDEDQGLGRQMSRSAIGNSECENGGCAAQ